MILKLLKSIYDYNKNHSTIFFRIVKNTRIVSVLSEQHKSSGFRTHIKKSSENIARLENYLKDDLSKKVLHMIVNARTRSMYDSKKYSFITQPQYFIDEIIASDQSYTLIDTGAYTGDTIQSFISLVSENYEEIFSFEPDLKNLGLLQSFINKEKIERVKVIKKGVYSKTQTLNFADGNSSSSKVDPDSVSTIQVTSPDDYFNNIEVVNPILKMDIEGAEPYALMGAENFINKYRPVLAICIYHEPEHLFEIPFYIKEKHPFYEFLIRHHSSNWTETVLYCLPIK